MENHSNRTNKTRKTTDDDILDDPVGRAFVVGFMLGFAAGTGGETEPDIDEIAKRFENAGEDLVLSIQLDNRRANDKLHE